MNLKTCLNFLGLATSISFFRLVASPGFPSLDSEAKHKAMYSRIFRA